MGTTKKHNRLKRYQFSISRFCEMFKQGQRINVTIDQGWPEDARIVGLHSDEQSYTFTVIVESKEFEPVKESELIPVADINLHDETNYGDFSDGRVEYSAEADK